MGKILGWLFIIIGVYAILSAGWSPFHGPGLPFIGFFSGVMDFLGFVGFILAIFLVAIGIYFVIKKRLPPNW